ncbi:MAG TPA: hypothetical protein DD435_10970, partial [Cyanobacteria bacterium UBA8530]|nr:hypothetical protein [Cyanobacteria bacterium UBA8530]
MKIGAKITASFAIALVLMATFGIASSLNLKNLANDNTEFYSEILLPIEHISSASTCFQRMRGNLRDIILDNKMSDMLNHQERIKYFQDNLKKDLAEFEKTISNPELSAEYKDLTSKLAMFENDNNKIQMLALSRKKNEALQLMRGEAFQLSQDIDASLKKLTDKSSALAKEKSDGNMKAANFAINLTLVLLLLAALIAAFLIAFFKKNISGIIEGILGE